MSYEFDDIACGGWHVLAMSRGSTISYDLEITFQCSYQPNRTINKINNLKPLNLNKYFNPFASDLGFMLSGGRQIFGHRLIIASRCSVFKEMIQHEEERTLNLQSHRRENDKNGQLLSYQLY